jgi:hypothetical protein
MLAGAVLVLLASQAFAQAIRITPLAREDRLLVSFEVTEAFTDDLREAIESGLPTSFAYDVELRRATPLWVDRLVSSARVSATVRYDNLTRRYHVTVTHDGRVELTEVTEDEAAVQRLVTSFQRLPLFSTRQLEVNADYYLRVRARTSPRSQWSMLPWDRAAALGSVRFTFIPQ